MGFTETITDLAQRLEAAGVPAAYDTRDLNPPAALITPAALLPPTKLCGRGEVRAFVDLVARDSGDGPALDQLQELHRLAAGVLQLELTDDPATFTRRVTGSDPTALPALRLTVETPTLPDAARTTPITAPATI